ncbi:hypothetical protein [Chitinimonas naiadis]
MKCWAIKLNGFIGISILFFSLFGCAKQEIISEYNGEVSTCKLTVPPMDSGKNSVHGRFLYIYPRVVASNYTGCQTMWDQDGRKLMVLAMRDGHPEKLSVSYGVSPESVEEFTCSYSHDELINKDEKRCEEFDKQREFGGLLFESNQLSSADPAYEVLVKLRAK